MLIVRLNKELRLIIKERDDSYAYILEKIRNNTWIKLRRWEKHSTHGGSHVHIYNKEGQYMKTEKDKGRNKKSIFKEISEKHDLY